MDELGNKVADLYALKAQMKEFKMFIDDLSHRFEHHTKEMDEYVAVTDRTLKALDTKGNDTNFRLTELKEYVEHFADNLILPSSQITVESSSGFDPRPRPLLEILKLCSGQFADVHEIITDQGGQLKTNAAAILTKADESVIFDVQGLQRKVTTIEKHLLKDEEQGVGAIRRTCEELTDKVQTMTSDMTDKVDRKEVGFIVHEKYEEIVKYLQDALQSSTEDENNFKQKADEIQALVVNLTNTKADRMEIAPMQEILVKTEAMLKRVSAQNKDKKDNLTRKEMEAFLELKVDKADFEVQLQNALKGSKRSKKLSALGGVSNSIIDEALQMTNTAVPESALRDKAMWKGLAEAMKDESEEAIMRAAAKAQQQQHAAHISVSASSDFGAYILAKKAQAFGKAATSMTLPSNAPVPGTFRHPTEGGRPGGPSHASNGSDNRPSTNQGYAAAYGQPGGPSYPSGSNGSLNAADVYNQANEYPHVPPTTFDPNFDNTGQEGKVPDMTFLGGQVAGGGYNQRQGTSLRQGALKPLGAPTGGVEDVEGLGL